MKLNELLQGIQVLESNVDFEMNINAVAYDSRKVTEGSLFVAITGFASDGNRFIPMALEKGAAVVVTAKKPAQDVPYVLVESDRYALAMIGTNFYGHPAEAMTMIGVTGTNGKTSVTLLLKHVLEKTLGAKVGLIGTMENLVGDEVIPTERTTPESFELQGLFARMRDAGIAVDRRAALPRTMIVRRKWGTATTRILYRVSSSRHCLRVFICMVMLRMTI